MTRLQHAIALGILLLLLPGCDRGAASSGASPTIAEVSVNSLTFVNPYSNTAPRLTDLNGAFLVRMELTPAKQEDADKIAATCRSGGVVIARITDSKIRPFTISSVSNDGDALVIVESRERALELFSALNLDPAGSPKTKKAEQGEGQNPDNS